MKRSSSTFFKIQDLENSYLFVENEILRKNLAINLQYIAYLIKQEEDNELPGTITYSIYKNLILYTTSIIEGLLIYTFQTLLDKGKISPKSMKSTTDFKEVKEIHKIDSSTTIIWCKRIKGNEKFTRRTSFHDVIKASKKANMLEKDLLDKIDDLREKETKFILLV